nr:MAG TPA: PR-1 protein fever, LIPID BINDING PROTEIN [Caudoviricetes sp.]
MNTKNITKYTLAGLGLTMGLAVAAAPALAAPTTPEPISAQVTKATSASRQTSSEVAVEGTWQTPRLTVGSTLTVGSVDGGFNWRANFPFTLGDGARIGECVADQATLTCTVTDVPEAWAAKEDVSGTFHARAQLTDKAVGTEQTSITLNGETVRTLVWGDKEGTGTCSNDCTSPAHYEYARPETVKYGWTDANGSIAWGIQWKVDPGTEYTITDETNALHAAVKCSTGPTWDPKTTSWTDGKLDDTKHTLVFTPPTGALTCVTFPDATQPIDGQTTYTNRATINGASLEATATVKAAGGTDGDGNVKPTPAPDPTPTTEPTPEPTEPTVNPSEKPNTSPTPAPKPSDEPQSTPSTDPKPEPRVTTEPVPVPTHATPKPEPKADTQPAPAPAAQLAKTGATLDGITVALGSFALGALLAAAGYAIGHSLGGDGR